jgi:hypothetical protein
MPLERIPHSSVTMSTTEDCFKCNFSLLLYIVGENRTRWHPQWYHLKKSNISGCTRETSYDHRKDLAGYKLQYAVC